MQKWPLNLQKSPLVLHLFPESCIVLSEIATPIFLFAEGERNMSKKKWNLFNSLALLLVAVTANSACLWYFHQPKFPEEANYLRKHND